MPDIECHSDGKVSVHMKSGSHFDLAKNPGIPITVNTSNIKSVGIKNLLDIESHFIQTILNSRSHVIKFTNGGLLQFAYNKKGKLIELSSSNLRCEVSVSGEITFGVPAIQ